MINNNMIDPSKIAELVKKTLKGSGYKVKMYTETGDSTLDPRLARRFFTMPDKIMVTLEDNDNLLKFHKSSSVEIDDIRDLHKSIKNLASKYNMDFVMREFGKEIEPKNYVSDSIKVINDNDDNASEIREALSKLAGTNLKSNQTLDNSTKIIIKHSKSIDEEVRGSRSRHIDKIYIENSQGERFRYPFKNMSGARAMARHIHEGGTPYDNVGKTIISVSEDNMKLSKFLRYSRNNGLNEANQDTIDAVSKKVESNKRFLHTLSNVNTYEATVNSIEDKIDEDKELDVANLKDAFTKRVFDENIEEVLPMVQKIIDEAGVAEAKKDPYAGMSMLDRAKKAELGPDISGEYSSKNIKKFADKKSEIVYKVTELNMRVQDDELNRVVTNAVSKLEDGKNVSRDEVDIIKALIARGKELGAYEESVKVDVVPEAEVAEWTEQVAGDKALFSEGDSVEDLKKQKAEAEDWFKKNPPPNPDSSGSQMDDAEYQQMVMHLSNIKDKLKKMGESIEEEDTVEEASSIRITDLEDLNLYDEEDVKAADSMSAEELKKELIDDLQHLHTEAADDFTDSDHIVDEMGDYFANMHRKADDKTLEIYTMARDLVDEDPAVVVHQTERFLRVLGANPVESAMENEIATIRARAGLPEVESVAEEKDPEEQKALADELELLATNDGDLYRQQYMPIIKNLMRKRAKGTYDHDLAVKLWRYLIDNVAKKEAGPMARTKFPGMIRNLAAKSIADMEQDKMDNGEYDDVNLKIGASEAVLPEDSHMKDMKPTKFIEPQHDVSLYAEEMMTGGMDKEGVIQQIRQFLKKEMGTKDFQKCRDVDDKIMSAMSNKDDFTMEDLMDACKNDMMEQAVEEGMMKRMEEIEKVYPMISKMKMDLVDKGMEPEDAHDEACEKYGVDPDMCDKYIEYKRAEREDKKESVEEAPGEEPTTGTGEKGLQKSLDKLYGPKEKESTKSMNVKKAVDLAMDSIWDKEGENPKTVNVTKITINNPHAPGGYMDDEPDEGYRSVNVEHDGPWTIYTDSGFEKAISDMVGFEVNFTEQGMQEDGMASMEGEDPKMAKEAVDRDLALIRSRAGI